MSSQLPKVTSSTQLLQALSCVLPYLTANTTTSNSHFLGSTRPVPSTVLSASCRLTHLVLKTILGGKGSYFLIFHMGKPRQRKGDQVIFQSPAEPKWGKWDLNAGKVSAEPMLHSP